MAAPQTLVPSSTSIHTGIRSAWAGRPLGAAFRRRAAALAIGWVWRDLGAVVFLLACTVAFFWPALAEGRIAYENDTRIFYYPLFVQLGKALKQGVLPLWSQQLFGGYPLFADGEVGAFYPFHLLALLAMPIDTAFLVLRPIRFFQAAVFSYLFCRTTGCGRFGALVGALVFAFGGFAVAQLHHSNIGTASVWLPLALAFAELALRFAGRRRYIFAVLTGVTFGMQGLIIHVQVVLMSAVTLAAYCGFRAATERVGHGDGPARRIDQRWCVLASGHSWLGPLRRWRPGAGPLGRLTLAATITAIAGAVGGGLAAVQLLPLLELSAFSFRGAGVDYAFASQYSLPPVQLVTLLLPDFFVTNGQYWGLWSHWEVFVYAGVAPLVLAVVGLVLSGRRLAVFFALLGGAALALALGEYSPFNIHHVLITLPGFSVLRAPGRFTFLVTFSIAMLAAFGADALCRAFGRPAAPAAGGPGGDRVPSRARLAALLVTLQALAVAVPLMLVRASAYVDGHHADTVAWLTNHFVRMRGFDPRFTAEHLYGFVAASLDTARPETLRQLALLLGAVGAIVLWDRLRSLRHLWQGLLLALVAVDLIGFGQRFHPTMAFDALAQPSGVAAFLARQSGLFRVYTQKSAADEPDRLIAFDLAEANGYSSLAPDRHEQFASRAEYAPSRLLDLLNARYYVVKSAYVPLASFNRTTFDTGRPIVSGTGLNPAGRASFRFDAPPSGDSLRVVSTLRRASDLPQGELVARLTVTDTTGRQQTFRMLAGVHTADWAIERPDLRDTVRHQRPVVAHTWQLRFGAAATFPAHFYYAEFPLGGASGAPVHVRQVDVEVVHPAVLLEIYGITLYDDTTKDAVALGLDSLAKLKRVYQDQEETVYENRSYLPRAFLVPSVVVDRPGDEILERLAEGDFAPERFVLIEQQFDASRLPPPAAAAQPVTPVRFDPTPGTDVESAAGVVHILQYADDALRFDVAATQNAMLLVTDLVYPGWKAYVDGAETPIYRGDALFRTIYVPAGRHTVEMLYRPRSFRLGLLVTLASTVVISGALLALSGVSGRRRRRRPRYAPGGAPVS